MAYPLEVGIGAAWFGRSRRFFSGGVGGTMESIGGCGGNTVLWIDGEWTCIEEKWWEALSSETSFATGLLMRYSSVILGNLMLKWSTVVADAVRSFRNM